MSTSICRSLFHCHVNPNLAMPDVGNSYEWIGKTQDERPHQGDRLRFLLLGRYVGDVIGKRGENVKKLQKKYNVEITGLSKDRTRVRVLQLDGAILDSVRVVKEILPMCPDVCYPSTDSGPALNLNLLVNSGIAGILVGKRGGKIREITEQNGIMMRVYPDCLPNSNERVVAMGGDDVDTVINGLVVILDILASKEKRAQTVYFRPESADSFDIYNDSKSITGISIPTTLRAPGIDNNNQAAPLENSIAAVLVAHRDLKERAGGYSSNDFGNVKTVSTLELSTDVCGAVIGKGGKNIKYIKQVSGARIDSTKLETEDQEYRTITMQGTQDQIQIAQQLMAQCVHVTNMLRQRGGTQNHTCSQLSQYQTPQYQTTGYQASDYQTSGYQTSQYQILGYQQPTGMDQGQFDYNTQPYAQPYAIWGQ